MTGMLNTPIRGPAYTADWTLRFENRIPIRSLGMTGAVNRLESQIEWQFLIHTRDFTDFLESAFPVDGVLAGKIEYPQYSRLPNYPTLGLVDCQFKPFVDGKIADPLKFDAARVLADSNKALNELKTYGELLHITAMYKTVRVSPTSGSPLTYLDVSASSSAELLKLPMPKGNQQTEIPKAVGAPANQPRTFAASTPVTDPNQRITVVIPKIEWTVKWDHVSYNYFNGTLLPKLRAKQGKVNSDTFQVCMGAIAESVLLESWSFKQSPDWANFVATATTYPPMDVEVKFIEKFIEIPTFDARGIKVSNTIVTWNETWSDSQGRWVRFLKNGTDPVFDSTTFNDIFQP